MRKEIIEKHRKTIAFTSAVAIFILLIQWNDASKAGITEAFTNCVQKLLPSVFPPLILTSFMTKTGLPEGLRNILKRIFRILFGLAGNCPEILLFGMISGYPAGIKTSVSAMKEGICTLEEAAAGALISMNPGIAFTILNLGKLCGSLRMGSIMYLSVTAGQLTTALLFRKKEKRHESEQLQKTNGKTSFSSALTSSVSTAAESCISMTAWISAYGVLNGLVKKSSFRILSGIIDKLGEVSYATRKALYNQDIVSTVFSLGFGGFCVILQLLPDLLFLRISLIRFLAFRFVNGIVSAGFAKILTRVFPVTIKTFSFDDPLIFRSRSFSEAISLIFFCFIFMFGIANKISLC